MKAPQLTLDRRLAETVDAVRERVSIEPRVGVVLDTELGPFTDRLRNAIELPYRTLPHMPVPKGDAAAWCSASSMTFPSRASSVEATWGRDCLHGRSFTA